MAYFAKLDSDNVVLAVHSVRDEDCQNSEGVETEAVGIQFLQNIHGWALWKKTSYNTIKGVHMNASEGAPSNTPEKAFRKNFASVGFTYDEQRDAFIPPKPYPSYVLNETSCTWEPPVPGPTIISYGTEEDLDKDYIINWDEENQRWLGADMESPQNNFIWNPTTLSWDAA